MSKFIDSMRTSDSFTYNGAVTHSTSLNAMVDLFFLAGACRTEDSSRINSVISSSYTRDPKLTLQIILWAGDIRNGAGERRFFRLALRYLYLNHRETFDRLVPFVPFYNRWDSLFEFQCDSVFNFIKQNINDGLLCKWLPRQKQYNNFKRYLLYRLKWTPSQYRKHIVSRSTTVEQKMCAKEWDTIKYEGVPSVAFKKYRKAFARNDGHRFNSFLDDVKNGNRKINASAIFPHDIIKEFLVSTGRRPHSELRKAICAQWDALPNYMPDSEMSINILPVCDVSGSMTVNNSLPLSMSIALGIYLSERNKGKFKDAFLTFSENPKMKYLKGDIVDRIEQLSCASWGLNTNISRTFELILKKSIGLDKSEVPHTLLIISDMEFDQASNESKTNFQNVKEEYDRAGIEMPQIVFWNVNGRQGNLPVNINDTGVCLISGASPSIIKQIISGCDMSPLSIMLKTLSNYDVDLIIAEV